MSIMSLLKDSPRGGAPSKHGKLAQWNNRWLNVRGSYPPLTMNGTADSKPVDPTGFLRNSSVPVLINTDSHRKVHAIAFYPRSRSPPFFICQYDRFDQNAVLCFGLSVKMFSRLDCRADVRRGELANPELSAWVWPSFVTTVRYSVYMSPPLPFDLSFDITSARSRQFQKLAYAG